MDDNDQRAVSQSSISQAPCITFSQFRKVARQHEWSLEWLVEQCKAALDHPTDTIRRVLEGARVEGHRQSERWVAPHWDDMADVVLPYQCLIDLYQRATRPHPALAGERACACGCGGGGEREAEVRQRGLSEKGIQETGERAKAGNRGRHARGLKCDVGGGWLGWYSLVPNCDNRGCHCPVNRGGRMKQGIGSVQQMFSKLRQPKAVEPGYMTETGARGPATLVPRLLDLDAAATYLSLSPWTIRDLEAAGVLPRVRVPLPQVGALRKLLFDKADLDRLIGAWKDLAG